MKNLVLKWAHHKSSILIFLGLTWLTFPQTSKAEDIVIGMSAAFKGPSRSLGIELYRGAQAYFEEVNSKGGVQGRKIVIKAYDDGYNPTPAVANTIQLEKEDVLLLFGYVGTPTTSRVLPLLKRYEKENLLLFFPFTGAEPLRRPPYDPFVFNLRASYAQETARLVDHFVRHGRKRIAVFYQVDAYGRTGWAGVRAALAQHHLSLAGEATYRRGTPFTDSMREQVEILRKTEADAIISIGSYGACAAFIRDTRDADWDVPIANVSFVGSESLLRLLMTAGEEKGTNYTRHLINSEVVPSYYDLELSGVRDYRAAMDRFNPMLPAEYQDKTYEPEKYSFVSFEGYLDAKLLTEILRRAKTPLRRSGLREATLSIDNFDLGIGKDCVSFRQDGVERNQALSKVYLMMVKDGRFMPLEKSK